MTPDEQNFVLSFIRDEHREWRKGVDERLSAIEREQAAAAAVQQALREAKLDAEYKTQSGSWDAPALQALTVAALQQHKKHSSIPPAARWIAKALDTALGKAITVATSILAGGLLHYLITHWPH